MKKKYEFQGNVWIYQGKAAWHFLTVPPDIATDIDYSFAHQKKGWGSLPVTVTIGQTTWLTSIFPDKKTMSYLLPLKAEVRKKEDLKAKSPTHVLLEITDQP